MSVGMEADEELGTTMSANVEFTRSSWCVAQCMQSSFESRDLMHHEFAEGRLVAPDQTNVPFVGRQRLLATEAEHATQRSGRARSG